MSGKIRIGIVGAGGIARARHIPGFRAIEGVEIVSVANRTRESAERVAKEFGIPRVYDNWLDLVAESDTDAICIAAWPNLHYPVTLAAFDSHKHVLCQARMAMNAHEARTMHDAARARPDLVAQVVPAPFTLAIDDFICETIASGVLGDILSVDLQAYQRNFVDRDAPLTWRQDVELSGVNVMTVGIWYETLMRWLGPASRVLAVARVAVPVRRDSQGRLRTVEIPDQVSVIGDWARGGQFNMRFSAVTGLAPANAVWLYGTEGTLKIETDSLRVFLGRRGDSDLREIHVPEEKRGRWRVEEEFVNAIRGIEQVRRTTFADGVRYMEFTEAVVQSARSGQGIAL